MTCFEYKSKSIAFKSKSKSESLEPKSKSKSKSKSSKKGLKSGLESKSGLEYYKSDPRSFISVPIETAYATSYWSSVITKGVPVELDYRCCCSEVRRPQSNYRVINFELVQPICPRYLNLTDGQTDVR